MISGTDFGGMSSEIGFMADSIESKVRDDGRALFDVDARRLGVNDFWGMSCVVSCYWAANQL